MPLTETLTIKMGDGIIRIWHPGAGSRFTRDRSGLLQVAALPQVGFLVVIQGSPKRLVESFSLIAEV